MQYSKYYKNQNNKGNIHLNKDSSRKKEINFIPQATKINSDLISDTPYYVNDYMQLINSADFLKNKVTKVTEKFKVGLKKIDYMHENLDNFKKMKKDILRIQASSNSLRDSKNRIMEYFSSRYEENPIDHVFISDSEENSIDSSDEISKKDLFIENRIFNAFKKANESKQRLSEKYHNSNIK